MLPDKAHGCRHGGLNLPSDAPPLDALDFIEYHFGTRHSTPPPAVVTVHQVHSACVVSNCGAAARDGALREDADALIENTPGVAIGIKTADCVPILLADPVQRAVGAVHAGWRGTASLIVTAAIRAMAAEFGTRPEDLRAAIGPAIGPCCYQVGPEVANEFAVITDMPVHLDLAAVNERQLLAAGLKPENIAVSATCTKCNPSYHSFRRDREAAGRMLSWIRILPAS